MWNGLIHFYFLVVILDRDGLGFTTPYGSYKKYGETERHSWYYFKHNCSSKLNHSQRHEHPAGRALTSDWSIISFLMDAYEKLSVVFRNRKWLKIITDNQSEVNALRTGWWHTLHEYMFLPHYWRIQIQGGHSTIIPQYTKLAPWLPLCTSMISVVRERLS